MIDKEMLIKRSNELIARGHQLAGAADHGMTRDIRHLGECQGWIAGAINLVETICGSQQNAYVRQVRALAMQQAAMNPAVPQVVAGITSVVEQLQRDVAAGFVGSVADEARAETFDDLLDHAEAYLKENRKGPAGVIAGVVFEDGVRRVCRKLEIGESGDKIDNLISGLVKADVLTDTKAKRARAAAGVRTKSTHADWDAFDKKDVEATIEFAREFIEKNLGTS